MDYDFIAKLMVGACFGAVALVIFWIIFAVVKK
jgi:hypothetical protein